MNSAEILATPVEAFVPHAGRMVLIDRVLEFGEEHLVTGVSIDENTLFFEDGAVPVWVGIEYMAQSIAAWAGVNARLNNQAVKIGFLLGTRNYQANASGFKAGDELKVTVRLLCQDERGLGVFKCSIEGGAVTVNADVNVFQPGDVQSFLDGMAK
jgi:predicted hotdog family 3-hydroxylacyl-ACP dehydratase